MTSRCHARKVPPANPAEENLHDKSKVARLHQSRNRYAFHDPRCAMIGLAYPATTA